MIGARRQPQATDRRAQQRVGAVGHEAEVADVARRHVRVGVHARPTHEPPALHHPRPVHALAHRFAGLAPTLVGERPVLHGGDLEVNVDAVEQRPRDAREIALHADRAAGARVLRIAVVAARAGVHRRRQHEARRIAQAHRRPRDGHHPVLHRLAQHLEHVLAKLGQLIEEQHAAVSEAHLARPRVGPAADQPRVADRVMRGAKRPPRDQGFAQGQRPGDGVDLRRLERLLEAHPRQDRRAPAREHRLARAGGAHHQHVVPLLEQPRDVHLRARQLGLAVEEIGQLGQGRGTQNAQILHHPRLRQVLLGEDQRLEAGAAGREGHRQRTAHGPDAPLQAQLTEDRHAVKPLAVDLAGRRQHPQGNRQVERGALLADVGRGEVHRDPFQRKRVPGVGERRVHPLASFFYGALRQAHGRKRRQAVRDVGLDVDQVGVDAEHGGGADAGQHLPHPLTPSPHSGEGERRVRSVSSRRSAFSDTSAFLSRTT